MLQLLLPLAWDQLMLRTFAPEVFKALAAARQGKRVTAAGEVVDDDDDDDGEEERSSSLAVDGGVMLGNALKALGAWTLLYMDVVPWETFVSMMAIDPNELAMEALAGAAGVAGGGAGGNVEVQGERELEGELEGVVVPPQAPTGSAAG